MLSRDTFDWCLGYLRAADGQTRTLPRLAGCLMVLVAVALLATAQTTAQPPEGNAEAASTPAEAPVPSAGAIAADSLRSTVAEPSLEVLREHIQKLNSPSYRTRQLAIWYLEQNAGRALPLLREAGATTDLNIGAEIVSLLSNQAMTPDPVISVAAHEALEDIAGGKRSVTAVSYLANSALAGIADRQEVLARESLIDLKVDIGPLKLTVGGIMQNEVGYQVSNIVHVTSAFTGTERDTRLFRFLRSCDTAYLEGDKISVKLLREVLAMPGLKRIILKGPGVSNELLTALFDVPSLEHLELVYADVDDGAIDTIVDLPLVDSLRIFGTRISTDGAARIKKELDGLDIYFGRGGFLGVQTRQNGLRVDRVVIDSGAHRAGIEPQDLITDVNDKPIKTFNQLRDELANFSPGEKVSVTVERFGAAERGQPFNQTQSIRLEVILGIQDTPTN